MGIDSEIMEIKDDNCVVTVERLEDGINIELFVFYDQLPELISLLKKAKD